MILQGRAGLDAQAPEVRLSEWPRAGRRRALHREIAERMEENLGPRVAAYYPSIAYHYEKAEAAAKTLFFLMKAGERAVSLAANKEAISSCERDLSLLPQGDGDAQTPAVHRRQRLHGLTSPSTSNSRETTALHPQHHQEATEWLQQATWEAERLSNVPEQIACRKCLDRWDQMGR